MAELSVTINEGAPPVLALSGEVDLSTAPAFEQAVLTVLGQGTSSLAIDLTRVSYLDSTGIGVLMKALKRCRERGGEVSIVGVSDRALRVMRLLSLDRVIRFYPHGAQVGF